MKHIKKNIIPRISLSKTIRLLGILTGILAGYIYYIKVGCNSGSCPITSNPWMSLLWGGIVGYLLADMVPVIRKKESKKDVRKVG